MKIKWIITNNDVVRLRAFLEANTNNAFVRCRMRRNLIELPTNPTKHIIFKTMVACLITTQQRSGPDSAVTKFINCVPFPLTYRRCIAASNPIEYVQQALINGRLRRSKDILPDEIYTNLTRLEDGLWDEVLKVMSQLNRDRTQQGERIASQFVDAKFKGFGPKQARNFLQSLGLTRFEIPIDGRITKWLNNFGFPLKLSPGALSDPEYYNFVLDGIQALCFKADVYPCVFDAAVFASYDNGWTEHNVVW